MASKAELETIENEVKEEESQSAESFFSINEFASMDEGFSSLVQSTVNIPNNCSTPKKSESTNCLPDVINSVESKTKKIAKSLEHLDFSAIFASTPQKYLNKTASCLDVKNRFDAFPVKSRSLGKGLDTPYPHSLTDLGMFPHTKKSKSQVFKAFLENYTYDTFKKVMKKMKKNHMTAAEAKLRTVIDEMESAINKSMEDCSESVASQVLKHINENKRRRNKSLNLEEKTEECNIPVTKEPEAKDLTYQIVKDFQSLASIASYSTTTLDSSLFDDRDLVNEPLRYRYSSYEEVSDVNPNTEQKYIRKHIHINEQIIKQITKMMKYGYKNQPQFLGSFIHLEGQRIFLVAKTRRDALLNNLYKIPRPINETSANITVEKLVCRVNISENLVNSDSFFLCILEHKATVYSTAVKMLNPKGFINFGGHFIFENVSNTFNIKVSVYSLTVKNSRPSCINLPILRRRPPLPTMNLIGVARIGLLNAKYRTFSLRNLENIIQPEYKLHATVEANLTWPSPFKTFLTVGSTKTDEEPTWTRKYCVLEDGQMKFFTSSSEEMFSNPVKVVDVRECQSVESSPIKFSSTSTLMLKFNEQEDKFFVTADTEDDVTVLLEKIKGILKLKEEWIVLKK